MSSEAKTAANRRNALKSTGPRTEAGKSRSRLNGVTHGIHAKTPVLRGEDQRAFHAMEQENLDYFRPVGPVENLLVREITAEQWRLGRCDRAEVALGRQVEAAKAARLFEHLDKKASPYAHSLLNPSVDIGNFDPSPVAANHLASLAAMRGLRWAKVDIVELSAADKKFINKKVAAVLDVGSTILESLVPAGERAPQERLDQQRRATMRVYFSYVDKLMELQEARLTVTMSAQAADTAPVPITGARHLKSVPTSVPANQNDLGPGTEGIAICARPSRDVSEAEPET
jgi:hypothetical protein